MTLRKSHWMVAACMAALSTSAYAQEDSQAGIVRISDGRARTAVKGASFHGHSTASDPGSNVCPDCYGNCHHGHHGHGFFRERYCKNSPDHGYSPPAKYPLHRRGVQYNSYFPHHWYGTPGASYAPAPVVYQPTDTTQLGYYYQHVPFWQPQPGMMPQRPIPAQWHIVAPPVHASRFHHGYGADCYGDQFGKTSPATSPSDSPTPVPVDPSPAPVESEGAKPEASVPPTPRQFENSAESGHIRRAGL